MFSCCWAFGGTFICSFSCDYQWGPIIYTVVIIFMPDNISDGFLHTMEKSLLLINFFSAYLAEILSGNICLTQGALYSVRKHWHVKYPCFNLYISHWNSKLGHCPIDGILFVMDLTNISFIPKNPYYITHCLLQRPNNTLFLSSGKFHLKADISKFYCST